MTMHPAPLLSRHRIRSDATRRRLCEAATGVLVEGGLRAFSFVKVCDKAGLSRGAIHHHYDTPADLLADVVAHIYDQLSAAVTKELRPRGTRQETVDHAIDALWKHLRTGPFRVLLEIRAATMSDATLAAAIAGPNDRINRNIIAAATRAFEDHLEPGLVRMVFAALTGLALQYFTLTTHDRRRANSMAADFIGQLKKSIHLLHERSADA
ncbi:TetR/AcrR family transcriptional regulator [Parvibaculum sp.]|uniref:TetR/AcrR family transcriptional regulator n=1 Tax=Parvibaculum sp. TaxID=2024848 RepID=UPI0034A093E2